MHRLPDLRARTACWRLPCTDQELQQAAAAVLTPDPVQAAAKWTELLPQSPTFALWAVCADEAWRAGPPADWDALAQWFLRRGQDLLAEQAAGPDGHAPQTEPRQRHDWWLLAGRFHQQLAAGDDSSQAAGPRHPVWLHGAAWLAASESQGRDMAAEIAPAWLLHAWRNRGLASGLDDLRALQEHRRYPPFSTSADPWLRGGQPLPAELWRLALRHWAEQRRREERWRQRLQEDKLEALRQLAYGASHELNNPLANIAARAQGLLRDERDPDRRRKLEAINRQAFRAHEMIADMMLFAHPPQMKTAPLRLADLAHASVASLQPLADAQQTELTLHCDDAEVIVDGDASYLSEAVQALLRNALEAVAAGGRVEVQVGLEGEHAVLRVRDNGPGLSETDRRHLFDPYYSGREAGRGLGLGLSKTWRIVREHGGNIEVDSGESGSVFALQLQHAASPATPLVSG